MDGVEGSPVDGDGFGVVVGVVGGSGGVGASSFAATLGAVASGAVLVDLDGTGGGLDVLLGIEDEPGARWSDLRLAGGQLDPEVLAAGLPRWGGVPVLAADVDPPVASVGPVLAAARNGGLAVVDLPRSPGPARAAAVALCTLVVVVAHAGVRGLAAARAVSSGLAGDGGPGGSVRCAPRAGLVLRRGVIRPVEAGRLVGLPVLGRLPRPDAPRDEPLAPDRRPARWTRVAAGLLDGLAGPGGW